MQRLLRHESVRRGESSGGSWTATHVCADAGGANVQRVALAMGDPALVHLQQLPNALHHFLTAEFLQKAPETKEG